MRKKPLIITAILLGLAFMTAAGILAAANAGSESNPLVTLSYLNEQFKPQILKSFDEQLSSKSAAARQELEALVAAYTKSVNDKLQDAGAGSAGFTLLTLSRGQTVTCSVGTEVLLRIGSAQAYGTSAPALVNSTAGTTLGSGEALKANNMYMVTIQGNGFKATADTVKVLIRGDYVIS